MTTQDNTQEIDAVKADIKKLREDIVALSESVRENLNDDANRIAGDARDAAERTATAARDKVREGVDSVGRQVEERPVASLAVAFGIGLLIGKLLDR